MKELQRELPRKDRPAYDPSRRSGFDRPGYGGPRRREGGSAGGAGRDSRPPRFERGGRESGPGGRTGFRPDRDRGPRPDFGPRREGAFRPERPTYDRERGPRPDRAERPRFDRPDRPRFERPGRPAKPGRPDRADRAGSTSAGLGPPRPVPAPEQPPLGRIRTLLFSYQMTAAILAAYSLGIFRELQIRPQSAADLARACACDPRGIEALLEAVASVGALQKHGPTYVLPRDLAPYLVPGFDGDATGQIDMALDLYPAFGDLARAVRDGTPRYPLTGDEILHGDPNRVSRYIRAVHTGSREAAVRIVQMAPLLPGSSLLDVAGGSGIFAATYARNTPDLKAHLFDLGPTLDVARDVLRAEGLDNSVTFHTGDYRHDPFPGPVDTVLLSNVLQTESEEHALGILRRAWAALRPGGTLLVHGVMPHAGAAPEPPTAFFSLLMVMLFGHGRAWSEEQVCEWLAGEHFGVRFVRPIGEPFHTKLILATRAE